MNISVRAVESGKIIRWLRELEENPLNYYQGRSQGASATVS